MSSRGYAGSLLADEWICIGIPGLRLDPFDNPFEACAQRLDLVRHPTSIPQEDQK